MVTPSVDGGLRDWRLKAVNVFALVSTVAYLPAMVVMLTGSAPPDGWPAHAIVSLAYLSFVACALLHRTDYRIRTWVVLVAGYIVALIHLVAVPRGPYGRALPAMLPILGIVVLGARAGWAVTALSVALILAGPLLERVPGLAHAIANVPARTPIPVGVVFHQGVALVALLVGQMFLLDRFHEFLMRSLAGLQRESCERAAAYANLEREMRERRRLEHEVARVGDEERRRLGHDVHDGVCQQIAAVLLHCQALQRRVEKADALKPADLGAMTALLEEAMDEAHDVARGLCPLDAKPGSLGPALSALVKRTQTSSGVACEFVTQGNVCVDDATAAQHLYRIAQEALSNAVRHSGGRRIAVSLCERDGEIVLDVQDDGVGLPSAPAHDGLGLHTMRYRAQIMNGELTIAAAAGQGTRLSCRIPRPSAGDPHPSPADTRGVSTGET